MDCYLFDIIYISPIIVNHRIIWHIMELSIIFTRKRWYFFKSPYSTSGYTSFEYIYIYTHLHFSHDSSWKQSEPPHLRWRTTGPLPFGSGASSSPGSDLKGMVPNGAEWGKREKPWDIHGKTLGKPWENHGKRRVFRTELWKAMGKPWENEVFSNRTKYEQLQYGKTIGKWWFFMGFHGV